MDYYFDCLAKYATFSGRARRKEFWMFLLVSFVISICVGVAEKLFAIPHFATFYNVAIFLPSLAVSIRRMHDVNKSGWYQLIPFYGFYLCCLAGDEGPNRFGPDPKETLAQNAGKISA